MSEAEAQSNIILLRPQPDGQIVHRQEGVLLITIHNSAGRGGCILEIPDLKSLEPKSLQIALKQASEYLGIAVENCEVKLIGASNYLKLTKDLLQSWSIPVKAGAERPYPGFDLVFDSKTGRLWVSLANEPQKPEKLISQAKTQAATPAAGAVVGAVVGSDESVKAAGSSEDSQESVSGGESKKIRVMIVDDSVTIQRLLTKILSRDPQLEVIAAIGRPTEAEVRIPQLRPDVITLDMHMPEMDGVALLKRYYPKDPIPTVVISSLSMEEGSIVLDALESGAIDYIQKPSVTDLEQVGPAIIEKVKIAAASNRKAQKSEGSKRLKQKYVKQDLVIAMGASTGGTEALKEVLLRLPAEIPPIVIVQHIPAIFSNAFASRLNQLSPFEVKEATNNDAIKKNRVLIAPGGLQMRVKRAGEGLKVIVEDAPAVNRHRPSVDYLFDSVAEQIGAKAIGVILTGMGGDGAKGMLKMKQAGARTVAQNEATCAVYGMPKQAVLLGAAEEVKPLLEIPELLVKWFS